MKKDKIPVNPQDPIETDEKITDWELYGRLGNGYRDGGQRDEAIKAYEKAIGSIPDTLKGDYGPYTSSLYVRLMELLAELPDISERKLLDLYQGGVEGWPEDGDFDYIMGKYTVSCGDHQSGERYIRKALFLLETYGNGSKSELLSREILGAYELMAICCYENGKLDECVDVATALLKVNPYLMNTLVVMLLAYRKDLAASGNSEPGAREVADLLGRGVYDYNTLKDRLFVLRAAMRAKYRGVVTAIRETFSPEEWAVVDRALRGGDNQEQKNVLSGDGTGNGLRIMLFYSGVESFDFFTDQLKDKLQKRGCSVFVLDLKKVGVKMARGYEEDERLERFLLEKVDGVICFDGLGIRSEELIRIWDEHQAVVVDIFMDPPLRFHPVLEMHPQNYHLFCCDREHVEYVKKYFKEEVPSVDFMPHVGVLSEGEITKIPYRERKYDILFSGTYYSPESKFKQGEKTAPKGSAAYRLYARAFENMKEDSSLSVWKATLLTMGQLGWNPPEHELKALLWGAEAMDWAVRMYYRERVVTVLAEAGIDIYLLGEGWENHSAIGLPNVHRIADQIPYRETLTCMADARINLNVMPGFKEGTHDRIFNTLLQHSVPLTDSSAWIDDHFTDGVDIALYDLEHLEKLPELAKRLLSNAELAERIIENGYEKVARSLTWDTCAEWILDVVRENAEEDVSIK